MAENESIEEQRLSAHLWQWLKDGSDTVPLRPLDRQDAQLALWNAMNDASKLGNRADDKLVIEALRQRGVCLARLPANGGVLASFDTSNKPVTERPVCTYASGCDCDVPRPLPQGNKAWHCPKQQEHAAKVWNSISVDEGRSNGL